MARIKILGSAVENPSNNNINEATMVSLTATSAGAVTRKTSGGATIGTLYVSANATVLIEKEPTDTLTHAAAWATKIAYNV